MLLDLMSVLSKEQEHAHSILIKDRNLFISGISGKISPSPVVCFGKARSRATAATAVTIASAANLLGSSINGYFGLESFGINNVQFFDRPSENSSIRNPKYCGGEGTYCRPG
jgi:hypothetical protein